MLPENTVQQPLEQNKPGYGFTGKYSRFTPEQTANLGLNWAAEYTGPGTSYEAGDGGSSVNANPLRGDPRIWDALSKFGITEADLLDPNRMSYTGSDRARYLQDTAGYDQEKFKEAMEKAGLRWEEAHKNDWVFGRLMQGDTQLGDATAVYSPDTGIVAPLSMMLMAVPGLGTAIGAALGASGIGATALGNALISGTMAKLGGGDFLKGAAAGGLGSLGGQLIGPLAGQLGSSVGDFFGSELIGDALTKALTSATSSGIRAGVGGRDISDALLGGFVSGGLSSGIGDLVDEYLGDLPEGLQSIGTKLATDYLTSQILGTAKPNAINSVLGALAGATRSGGTGGGGGGGGGGGLSGLGVLGSLLSMGALGQGGDGAQSAPHYARTTKSPFGSILG